jgi:hypothetical protein
MSGEGRTKSECEVMEQTVKKQIFIETEQGIMRHMPELTDSARRKLAFDLTDVYYTHLTESHKQLSTMLNKTTLEYEQNRTLFMDMISMIHKSSEAVLNLFEKKHLAELIYDQSSRQNVWVAKTTVVKDLVDFLNKLNVEVIKFYKDVYKIEPEEKHGIQASLF